MLISLPSPVTPTTPCGMRGLGCTGQCAGCPARAASLRGLGDFSMPDISALPAPLNSWPVLIGIAGLGGFMLLKGASRKRKSARVARLKARLAYQEAAAKASREAL